MLDKIRNLKMLPIILLIAVLAIIMFGLFFLSQSRNSSNTLTIENTPPSSDTTLKSKQLSFGSTDGVEKIGNPKAIIPYVQFSDTETIYLNEDYNFTSNKGLLKSKEIFLPDSIYTLPDNKILINQPSRAYIYESKTGLIETLPESIYSVAPEYDKNGTILKYFYIQDKNDKVSVKSSLDLTFADPQTYTSVNKANFAAFDQVEIRVIGGKAFFFEYNLLKRQSYADSLTNPIAQKNLSIYSTDPQPELKFYLPDLQSIQFSRDYLLYTTVLNKPNDVTNLEQNLINFVEPTLIPRSLDFSPAVIEKGIYGQILADRCTFDKLETKIICLVKETKSGVYDPDARDLFMQYSIDENSVSFLYDTLNVAGESIHYDNQGQLYIFGQGNKSLFRILGK
jgi:hypothetical protein